MSANVGERRVGGGSGIRTHDTVSRIHAFQACALSHSAIPPRNGAASAGNIASHRRVTTRTASIGPAHVARFANVVAAELARAVAERRRARELEQSLQAGAEIVALTQHKIEAFPDERHEIEGGR